MSFLFHIEKKVKVFPKPEVLLIEPFKTIWERDKTEAKDRALKEFAYIELFTSKKKSNPYKDYNDDARKEILIKTVVKIKGWKPDKLVEEAIAKLIKFQMDVSPFYRFYLTNMKTLKKLDKFLQNIDLNERSAKTGLPVYKPSEIYTAIERTNKVLQELKQLEKKVHEELEEATSVRGNKMITYFNDPTNFKDF